MSLCLLAVSRREQQQQQMKAEPPGWQQQQQQQTVNMFCGVEERSRCFSTSLSSSLSPSPRPLIGRASVFLDGALNELCLTRQQRLQTITPSRHTIERRGKQEEKRWWT